MGGGGRGLRCDGRSDTGDCLETFDIRMLEIGIAGPAGLAVGLAEGFGASPVLEMAPGGPDGVRGVKRVVLGLGAAQQAELDEARYLLQMRIPFPPHGLEIRFPAKPDLEAVHGDKH